MPSAAKISTVRPSHLSAAVFVLVIDSNGSNVIRFPSTSTPSWIPPNRTLKRTRFFHLIFENPAQIHRSIIQRIRSTVPSLTIASPSFFSPILAYLESFLKKQMLYRYRNRTTFSSICIKTKYTRYINMIYSNSRNSFIPEYFGI